VIFLVGLVEGGISFTLCWYWE